MVIQYYKSCGINISSEIPLPEFIPTDYTQADLHIRLGQVPDKPIGQLIETGPGYIASSYEYIFRLPNVAAYYIVDGQEIRIEPAKNADNESIRLFLLNQALPQALFQRNMVPLKASGIIHNNQVILLAGQSGAGKSTLLAAMRQRGYEVFSDDLCVLRLNESGETEVLAGYATMKLWTDTFKMLRLPVPDDNMRVRPNLPKYNIFIQDEFVPEPHKTARIFLLNTTLGKSVYHNQVLYAFMFKAMVDCLHGKHINKRPQVFAVLTSLLKNTALHQIKRSIHGNTIDEMIEFIETQIC